MLPVVCFYLLQKLLLTAAFHGPRQRRKIVANRERLWSLPIHYRIESHVDKKLVKQGLSRWEQVTCVTFVEVIDDDEHQIQPNNVLSFIDKNGCYSNIGYAETGGHRFISLSSECATLGVLLHEIGHALGLWHEQNRADSDKYITIQYESILPGWLADFTVKYWLDDYGVPYDYGSIMHYSSEAFAREGQRTILPVDINYEQTIGQRNQISFYDAALVNRAYCPGRCEQVSSVTLTCQNDGYVDPISCNRCLCPTGFTGTNCEQIRTDQNCSSAQLQAAIGWQNLTWSGSRNCTWIIQAPQGQKLELIVTSLEMLVDDSPVCYLEYVEIKYYQEAGISGARFCHHGPEKPIISETNRVLVIYYGDGGSFALAYKVAERRPEASGNPAA